MNDQFFSTYEQASLYRSQLAWMGYDSILIPEMNGWSVRCIK